MPPARAFTGATAEERREDFVRLLRQVPAITDVAYLDASGREQVRVSRFSPDRTGTGLDRSSERAFREAKPWKSYFGPVYFWRDSEPYITVAVAEPGPGGGVAVAEVSLKVVTDVVKAASIGREGRAYLVDDQGRLIAHPDLSLVLKNTDFSGLSHVKAALTGTVTAPASGEPAPRWLRFLPAGEVSAAREFPGELSIGQDFSGGEVLEAHASVNPPGWMVFIEQPTAVALEPLRASLSRTLLLLIIGVLISIAAGLVLARRLTTPIRALQASASRIGAGALDQRIEVKTGDEIEALAEEFNRMSAQLRELYQALERKVAERTQDLAQALDEQTATSEVLATMTRSTRDLTPVVATVLSHASRLCHAEEAFVFRLDGEVFRLQDVYGAPPEIADLLNRQEIRPGTGTLVGRVALERKPVHMVDVLADREYEDTEGQRRFGYRTLLGVPLMRDGQTIGVIGLGRQRVEPFTERELQLVTTLGDQTVIAVENVALIQEIEEKSRQLELASQHKSEFLAHMSHELRTPLNAIIGFSDVLRERMFGPLNEKQEEYVGDILTSGHHLLSLINDVLDLSKIEAGQVALELSTVWLPELLEGCVSVFREAALRRNVHLGLTIDPRLGPIEADGRKVKQVLLNLLSNALKFTPDGGEVEVTARLLGDVAQIAVRDTGIGIASEDQARIFGAFQQVRWAGETKEGTGLGLTLARQFVEMHGGRLWLESAPGEGSTFTFTLAVRSTPDPGAELGIADKGSGQSPKVQLSASNAGELGGGGELVAESSVSQERVPGPVVLAIDDDPMALELIRATLAPAGYEVLAAARPADGVVMALARRPALVIVDLMMPGMDGFEVIERLGSDPMTAGVPILVLTGKAVTGDEQDRLQPQISYLVEKAAFRSAEFRAVVERFCPPWAA